MHCYSTNNKQQLVPLRKAVLESLPLDGGLYCPSEILPLSSAFLSDFPYQSSHSLIFEVAHHLIGNAIPKADLRQLIDRAIDFPAPLVSLNEQHHILELFHGPTLAFKDFGACFLAELMAYFNQSEDRPLTVLVATSGDTGGAVAKGFHLVEGVEVVILYPAGKVSPIQELQLTTLGDNITALAIDGTFDDCQRLVKQAFLDKEVSKYHRLTSANSINIGRLMAQVFYYFEAYKQWRLKELAGKIVFSVPCGNLGNLTAGLWASKMGLPIAQFIAATNQNAVFTDYLNSGQFVPKRSTTTLSNAMDVGNPSNFARILDICSTWNIAKKQIKSYSFDDVSTQAMIRRVWKEQQYLFDPHTAVAVQAAEAWQESYGTQAAVVSLGTAHPAKFRTAVESIIDEKIVLPAALQELEGKEQEVLFMEADFEVFKDWLMKN